MAIEYYISQNSFNEKYAIPLNNADWKEIKSANEFILNILFIEQKYDLMISNYYEFEENLLQQALDHSIRSYGSHELLDSLLNTTRKVINLISSIVLFSEHVEKRHTKRFLFDQEKDAEVFKEFRDFTKNSMDYRFIKGLRNHVAHRDLPMDSYSNSSSWDHIDNEEERKLGHFAVPTVKKDKLIADEKFSTTVVEAMKNEKGRIDLRIPIRNTLAGLSEINIGIRKNIAEDYDHSKNIIYSAIDRFKENIEGNFYHCAVKKKVDEEVIESFYLNYELFHRVDFFYKRNKSQGVLERRYVHNRL